MNITKTFTKPAQGTARDIEAAVNEALKRRYKFRFVYQHGCSLRAWNGYILDCPTPAKLYAAWDTGDEITFSVTLPAKYWR